MEAKTIKEEEQILTAILGGPDSFSQMFGGLYPRIRKQYSFIKLANDAAKNIFNLN